MSNNSFSSDQGRGIVGTYFVSGRYYRGGGRGCMPKNKSAQDVICYEREELGNGGIIFDTRVNLSTISARDLRWVTTVPEEASAYGEVDVVVVGPHRILASDGRGGVLIALCGGKKELGS